MTAKCHRQSMMFQHVDEMTIFHGDDISSRGKPGGQAMPGIFSWLKNP
jgi:hypothetical protein